MSFIILRRCPVGLNDRQLICGKEEDQYNSDHTKLHFGSVWIWKDKTKYIFYIILWISINSI